jgi:hypothetical protein
VRLSQSEIELLERTHPSLEDILPPSPLQEGLLFHTLYDTRAPDLYTVQLALDLEGQLDESALKAAVHSLMQRHASLRASFHHENLSQPAQIIMSELEPAWQAIDLSLLMEQILAEDRARRFDLASPPLLRCILMRLAADRHRFVLTNHHILMDGWSMAVAMQELLSLYASKGVMLACPA